MLVDLTDDPPLQPPADAANTRNVISPPISSPKPSDISALKEARAAPREDVTSSGPISSTNSLRPTTQPRPVAIPPPSRDVLPSQALRDTGSKLSLGLPEPGERREQNESSLRQVDSSRERNATRPRAQQVDLTASVQPSAKPSPPPPPLKQPSASTSPLPPPAAPVLGKMASSRARGALPYEPQVPSRGTPFESPHPAGEDRGKAPPDEQSRMNSSVTSRGLPFAKPSAPPPPPLKQPSASTSPLPPPAAPVLAKMVSSRARDALPYEPQAPSRGTPFESPRPSGGDRGKTPPEEQSRMNRLMNSSVTPRGVPLPPDNRATAATGPPSQPQPASAPRHLEKSNSRLIESEGATREAKRATERLTSDIKERKGAAAPEEYETRPEDSATGSDGAKRLKAEPNPPTSFTHKQAPAESSVERTYSFSKPSRGDDFSTPHSETGKSRAKVVQSSDPAPSLGMKETHFTRPPPAPTQNQPKLDIGVPPKGNSIGVTPFSTQGQHKPNVDGTRVVLPPPLSRTPSVAEGPQIPTTSSGKPPRFSLP